MGVSVIIPARDEEDNLRQCLEAVNKQSLKPIECIVIDNGSKDKTPEVGKEFGAKVIYVPRANIGELRNIGASNATGNVFAFLDADCVPEENWLLTASKVLEDKDIGAVGNTVIPPENGTWVEKVWYFGVNEGKSLNSRYIGSANLVIRKEVFERVNGFNSSLKAGEDREFSWKIQCMGLKTMRDGRIRVIHLGYPKNISGFFKREMWHGKSIISDLRNLLKSRIIYVLFLISLLLLALSTSVVSGRYAVSVILILTLLSIPLLISLYKCVTKKNVKYVFPLAFLYLIYLTARTISFYGSIYRWIRCNVEVS